MSDTSSSANLTWLNVAIGLGFIGFDALLSLILGLGIGGSLIVAATRCIVQLAVMGLILDKVFAAQNVWGVAGIALLLNLLGAFETTFNKSKRRFTNMFPLVLCSMLVSTVPISVVGSQFALAQKPFWQPDQYVPILGMILGNAISAIGVGINTISREFAENKDKVETYLATGASRFEAVKPVAVEALKLALLPTVNQMSVIGLISIPGMMTGAIVGGKSVEQAARLQMIIMFTSSALCTLTALTFACLTLVDSKHRLRPDRLNSAKPFFYRWRDDAAGKVWKGLKRVFCCMAARKEGAGGEEGRGLLRGD